jgi:DNA repair protein RecO (recombination protein O)
MLINTKAIVFKSVKFQESSLIVKMFTETHGVQTFMVKGVRSVRANGKAAMFQSGMLLDIIMYYQENKSFKTIKEYKASYVYNTAFYDIRKSSVLMFLLEVLERCIHDDHEDDKLFLFVSSSLMNFDKEAFTPDFHIYFLLEFMKHLGIFPSGQCTQGTPYFSIKEGEFVATGQNNPFVINQRDSAVFAGILTAAGRLNSRNERKKVLAIIIEYFTFHIENFKGVKSLKVLETILA